MNKKLDVVFILDKSGSMGGSEENTISSFNEYLEKERKNKYNTKITSILFSDNFYYLHNRIDISKVENLTYKDYCVGGCTALYDALGNAINSFNRKKTDKVLFIIITDGYENASREFNKNQITKLIKKHSDWEFIYIGADIDSYAAGGAIGIKKENIANYKKDSRGTRKLFNAIESFECAMMSDSSTTNWKEDLDDYLKKNM